MDDDIEYTRRKSYDITVAAFCTSNMIAEPIVWKKHML